ncbi:aminodeoxychorismate lyase [Corynebacterium cystitidis]|uniref:aminodeoxychorismate lyase n=1 Tax=Corynebacterium cystitidis TaxID=35757 RepID=UPI00211E4FE8|nr:aminodeoxychorismate lyase [Corynebacterium cystitidis]
MSPVSVSPQPVIYIVEPFGGSVRRQNPNLPHVFWDDAAVTRGDGVFESILVRNSQAANLRAHRARFARSAQLLDLPEVNEDSWVRATREAVADFARERSGEPFEATCTWTFTRGRESTGVPSAWITLRELPASVIAQRDIGVKVMTAPRGYTITPDLLDSEISAPWLAVGAKTLNYVANMAGLRWARAQGFDDVIYIEPAEKLGDARVLEGATSTVLVFKKGGKIRTPHHGGDVLAGTTQQAIFETAQADGWRCKTSAVTVDELRKAESVWLVSSTRVATRVTKLNDEKMPAPANEAEIRALFEKVINASLED